MITYTEYGHGGLYMYHALILLLLFLVDVGFLMRLYHSTQAEKKLKKCFQDLSLGYLLKNYTFWLKAKNVKTFYPFLIKS